MDSAPASGKPRICMENIDILTEDELMQLENEYKQANLPNYRKALLVPYHGLVLFCLYKYMKNFKYIAKRLFRPKTYSLWEIVKYGTVQAIIFTPIYVLGVCTVSGMWHPIHYTRNLAKIKGRVVDNYVRFDSSTQEHLLFGMMKYFGLSNEILEKAKEDLEHQKKELEDKKFFSKDSENSFEKINHSIFIERAPEKDDEEEEKKENEPPKNNK